jgi:hypothetical protein
MRKALLSLIGVFALSGCGLELLTTTAIQGELAAQNAGVAARALHHAQDSTNEAKIQQAINLYKADKGQYPPSLEALVPNYLDSVPVQSNGAPYAYDPVGGRLTTAAPVAAAPAALAGNDTQKLQEISAAVQRYAQANGRYPASLWSLVPAYLATYPKTAGGKDFLYDPRTGGVFLPPGAGSPSAPPAVAQQPAGPRQPGISGGPLLGEAMTGIAISNQLDSMSNAGVSAGQGYAGSNIGRIEADHNARQQKALQDLGM